MAASAAVSMAVPMRSVSRMPEVRCLRVLLPLAARAVRWRSRRLRAHSRTLMSRTCAAAASSAARAAVVGVLAGTEDERSEGEAALEGGVEGLEWFLGACLRLWLGARNLWCGADVADEVPEGVIVGHCDGL